jgi:hypothetical protein
MSTPTATPPLADTVEIEAPRPPRKHSKLARTLASGAVAIGIAVFGLTHDGSKSALEDFAKDLKDEPGITSVKSIEMPGYAGALDINAGAATVRAKKEGSVIVLSYQVLPGVAAQTIEASIEHAAKEAGFDDRS